MTELRVSFPVLEDASTQAGLPIHKVLQGDTLTAKNAHGVFAYKDAAGNARYAKVDSQDRIIMSPNGGDTAELWERGELAAGQPNTSFATVTGALIALTPGLSYNTVRAVVSCSRDAQFQVVWNDDGAETILEDVVLEAGESTQQVDINLPFDAGATGTQELKLVAKNLNAQSALRGTLAVTEVQP